MSDYELTANDATSRPEERNTSDTVLHAGPYRHVESRHQTDHHPARPFGRKAPQSTPELDAEQILRSFNTWAYKREQPSDPQLMLQIIARVGRFARGSGTR